MHSKEAGAPRLCVVNRVGWLVALPLAAVYWRYVGDLALHLNQNGPSLAAAALVLALLLAWLVPMWIISWGIVALLETFFESGGSGLRRTAAIGALPFAMLVSAFAIPFLLDRALYDWAGLEPQASRRLFDWLVERL